MSFRSPPSSGHLSPGLQRLGIASDPFIRRVLKAGISGQAMGQQLWLVVSPAHQLERLTPLRTEINGEPTCASRW